MNENTVVGSESELQALYGKASPNSLAKESGCLTPAYQQWIEQAPFMAVASSGARGLDCSPRGDNAGELFRVLDAGTIVIPDRPGNNRLDTLRNIVTDPRIALLFLIPGIKESMRINGSAVIETDESLLESFSVNGKKPVTVLVVTIQSIYFQCGKALLRSKLWEADAQLNSDTVPTAGRMLKSVMGDFDATAYDQSQSGSQPDNLY